MDALQAAKQRLSEAAARCLAGDTQAAADADAALSEVKTLLAETHGKQVTSPEFRTSSETVR